MLEKVKLALRITTDAFDSELNELIQAAVIDLDIAGIDSETGVDPIVSRAIITYCKLNFGEQDRTEMYDRLKALYRRTEIIMLRGDQPIYDYIMILE